MKRLAIPLVVLFVLAGCGDQSGWPSSVKTNFRAQIDKENPLGVGDNAFFGCPFPVDPTFPLQADHALKKCRDLRNCEIEAIEKQVRWTGTDNPTLDEYEKWFKSASIQSMELVRKSVKKECLGKIRGFSG